MVLRARIPVILCLDVEPDAFFLDRARPGPWQGYERAFDVFARFRQQVESRTGQPAAFAWFLRMDPQVAETYGNAAWIVQRYAVETASLIDAGDEPGLHVHAYRWDTAADNWVVDHGNQDWVDHCVRSSFEAFERALGRRCRAFRFGDRWMSDATLRLIETFGARYDLTPEPGYAADPSHRPGHQVTGSLPDYTDVPAVPYRPAPDDYRRPDDSRGEGLWVIPLTTAPVQPSALRWMYHRAFFPTRPCGVSTALVSQAPALFTRIIDHGLRRPMPYLALPLRVGALAVPRLARRVSANLRTLLEHPLSDRFAWMTPAGALAALGLEDESSGQLEGAARIRE